MSITLEDVRRALALPDFDPIPAQALMAPVPQALRPLQRPDRPGNPRMAGVLVLLYPDTDCLNLVLMRRAESGGVHSGQVSFPGGKHEPGETFEQTALREAYEEIGAEGVRVLGQLTPLYVPPSDFEIYPTVGYIPARLPWRPHPGEVAEILEGPLDTLLDDGKKGREHVDRGVMSLDIGFYWFNGHKVWGATAIMLSELEQRLRQAQVSTINPQAGSC